MLAVQRRGCVSAVGSRLGGSDSLALGSRQVDLVVVRPASRSRQRVVSLSHGVQLRLRTRTQLRTRRCSWLSGEQLRLGVCHPGVAYKAKTGDSKLTMSQNQERSF